MSDHYDPVPDEERILTVTLEVPYFGKPDHAGGVLRSVVDAVYHGVGRNVVVRYAGEVINSAELLEDS